MPFPRSCLIAVSLLALGACKPAEAVRTSGDAAKGAALTPTPVDGLWSQASVTCAGGRAPTEAVEELSFGDAGAYSVTYSPFETYKDYWGRARFDLDRGEIAFTREGGNFLPTGLDLEGRVKLEGGRLTITEVWFGDRSPEPPPPGGCAYEFKRYGT